MYITASTLPESSITRSAHRRRVTVRSESAIAMQPSKPAQMPVTGVPNDGCTASIVTVPGTTLAVALHKCGWCAALGGGLVRFETSDFKIFMHDAM